VRGSIGSAPDTGIVAYKEVNKTVKEEMMAILKEARA